MLRHLGRVVKGKATGLFGWREQGEWAWPLAAFRLIHPDVSPAVKLVCAELSLRNRRDRLVEDHKVSAGFGISRRMTPHGDSGLRPLLNSWLALGIQHHPTQSASPLPSCPFGPAD